MAGYVIEYNRRTHERRISEFATSREAMELEAERTPCRHQWLLPALLLMTLAEMTDSSELASTSLICPQTRARVTPVSWDAGRGVVSPRTESQ